jgi:hypothetical protein
VAKEELYLFKKGEKFTYQDQRYFTASSAYTSEEGELMRKGSPVNQAIWISQVIL